MANQGLLHNPRPVAPALLASEFDWKLKRQSRKSLEEEIPIMFRRLINKKTVFLLACCAVVGMLAIPATTRKASADDLTGRELLSVTRAVMGGADYRNMQYVTAYGSGFVNAMAFASVGATSLMGAVEVKVNVTDYQNRGLQRRLDVSPTGAMAMGGPTFLVYTGTTGGGMVMGNEIRVSELAASRHWGMMGFNTLNRAIEGSLMTVRQPDQAGNYVVEVKFNQQDTVRYYIDKNTFLINKVTSRYNSTPLIEEMRSDYRRAGCMWLPFHVITKLGSQRLADIWIERFDLETAVPEARFTMTVNP